MVTTKGLLLVFTVVSVLASGSISCAPLTPAAETPVTEKTPTLPASEQVQATVVRVVDGDTIEVDIEGWVYKVRYIGVDTPELGQPGGEEAKSVNNNLVGGRAVELEKDISEIDRYGRLLRYVWVEGSMVNALLVSWGYAQVATYPPDVKYQQEFLELQRQAKEAGLGLWSEQQPTQATQGVYVGSINSNKYHYPSCRYAQQILPRNQIWFSSVAGAQGVGYVPCKVCNPPTVD